MINFSRTGYCLYTWHFHNTAAQRAVNCITADRCFKDRVAENVQTYTAVGTPSCALIQLLWQSARHGRQGAWNEVRQILSEPSHTKHLSLGTARWLWHPTNIPQRNNQNARPDISLGPVPVAARSKAWVCGRSRAETVGSNPSGGMDVCLLWVLYVVRYRPLRQADNASRGVHPTVVHRRLWSRNLNNVGAMAQLRPQRHMKKQFYGDKHSNCRKWEIHTILRPEIPDLQPATASIMTACFSPWSRREPKPGWRGADRVGWCDALICSLGHRECDGHTVHKLSQRRLTADWLAPREDDCSRMQSKISSDWLPS